MTKYITEKQAYDAVDMRINELKVDTSFTLIHEICISGVKKHIRNIPPADVIETDKIIKAINKAKRRIEELANGYDREIGQEKKAFGLLYALQILNEELGE